VLTSESQQPDSRRQQLESMNLLSASASASASRAGPSVPTPPTPTTAMLEWPTAPDLLQAMLSRQRDRLGWLEGELRSTRRALAQARAELAGTLASARHARRLALHDSLTQLPNQRCFCEHLVEALTQLPAEPGSVAVLYIDLDGFKAINDEHGHDIGDELLRIVAARLGRATRAGDLVCRVGGDEFACLLSGAIHHERLRQLACKLFEAVSAPLCIDTLQLRVSPSIGIATGPMPTDSAQDLLKRADAAMYRAKRERSGYAFCHTLGALDRVARDGPNRRPAPRAAGCTSGMPFARFPQAT